MTQQPLQFFVWINWKEHFVQVLWNLFKHNLWTKVFREVFSTCISCIRLETLFNRGKLGVEAVGLTQKDWTLLRLDCVLNDYWSLKLWELPQCSLYNTTLIPTDELKNILSAYLFHIIEICVTFTHPYPPIKKTQPYNNTHPFVLSASINQSTVTTCLYLWRKDWNTKEKNSVL